MQKIKSYIKHWIQKYGYRIEGYHHIYLMDSDEPRVFEFIGLAGKTHTLKRLSKEIGLMKIKPNYKDEMLVTQKIQDLDLFLKLSQVLSKRTDFYQRFKQMFDKMILVNQYKDFNQFWDEGIIKSHIDIFLELYEDDPKITVKFLKRMAFIIVLPDDINIIKNRYLKRSGLADIGNGLADYINNSIRAVNAFIKILDDNMIDYIRVDTVDMNKDIVRIITFVNDLNEKPSHA
jgi:deoxyadenosine/deoxycytidine kinase